MHEADTLWSQNFQESLDFDGQSIILIPLAGQIKNHPYQAFNVIVQTEWVRQSDLSLFGEHDRFVLLPVESTGADLVARLGIFPSKSQARKNGWDRPIPDGWSELRAGKNVMFVWKPTE